jgi:intraflagellar transport protein 122
MSRKLDRQDAGTLRHIAKHFTERKEYSLAADIYTRIDDQRALVHMYVNAQLWQEVSRVHARRTRVHGQAFAIVNASGQYKDEVYLPYARWLAENDRFEEAQKGYLADSSASICFCYSLSQSWT